MSLKAEALLLDLDGTLIDSSESIVRCWLRWAREFDVDPELLANAHGRPSAEILAELLPAAQVAPALARIDQLEIEDAGTVGPMPGAVELLAALPRDRWAIVTSGNARLAAARIQAAGLPAPVSIVTADDVVRGKPDPEPYLLAASRLGAEPSQCVVIEDAPSGMASARAAGMAVVGITSTHDRGLLDADLLAESPARLRVGGAGPIVVTVDTP